MLQALKDQRPDDPFPHYGWAMELRARGELQAARAAFDELLRVHPAYVPSYLMFGQLLSGIGDNGAAAEILRRGMVAAQAAADAHAAGELEEALAALGQSLPDGG